jgi:hypothetical protein
MAANVSFSFELNRSRIARLLRLPGGVVDRNLRQRVERVQAAAERFAPGSMGDGIRSRIDYRADGPVGVITSTHPATIYVVNGTRPHLIFPRRNRPNPHLRFTVNGRVVYARFVNHPGTRPNDFMIRALREAL